ncbi:WD40 repeat domain-containing protein [[Actinomadura] parvosata]|uniref:WD40 repeat domain-containing protein n=1 Tax=[Actinomadura] parvosata TaxID=1955412 RepID=UPI00406D43DA
MLRSRRDLLTGPTYGYRSVALSADGRTALTGDESGVILVWDLSGRSRPSRLSDTPIGAGAVEELTLSADGRPALAAGDSGDGVLLDLSRLSRPVRPASLSGDAENVSDVALSGDGRVVLMSSRDGGVRLWALTGLADLAAHPLDAHCELADPDLTWAEWSRFTGGADWEPCGGYGTVGMYPC